MIVCNYLAAMISILVSILRTSAKLPKLGGRSVGGIAFAGKVVPSVC